MEHTEILSRYVGNFVDEMATSGITDAIISPGSRSTPLALAFAEHHAIQEWIVIDERSAAFFALGLAKQTKRSVVLVCTSGTAAANYFPAIVEAFYSRVPLVVLTADRPPELRDIGAPQTIGQLKLYGDYVKWFHEMALPEADPAMMSYARKKASRAVYVANQGNPGPVHLNMPFREPLPLDFTLENIWSLPQGYERIKSRPLVTDGKKRLPEEEVSRIAELLHNQEKGIIVCGPQMEADLAQAVISLAQAFQLPVLTDPLSQVRAGIHEKEPIIEGYDAFLRNETIREKLKPDFILRFGAMPVSKAYTFYVKESSGATQFVVEGDSGFREPAGMPTEFIYADPAKLCEDLIAYSGREARDTAWLKLWQEANQIAKKHLLVESGEEITEGEAVLGLLRATPEKSCLYVGNSMAVRDVDTFFMTTPKQIEVLSNRGANGIDGMVSSGIGAAAKSEVPLTLLLGDLSFFHDMNGLLAAKHYQINITILLVNNNGGGIFSFLSQAEDKKHFETLFGTPADIDFRQAVQMYGGSYRQASTKEMLEKYLNESYVSEGLSVIEVKTDREENTEWHREKWQTIAEEILNLKD